MRLSAFPFDEYQNGGRNHSYEDRTSRFYPSGPRAPRLPGVVPGDSVLTDDGQDSIAELSNAPDQHFNILCSADKDGNICFSIFGIFPIGKCVSRVIQLDEILLVLLLILLWIH